MFRTKEVGLQVPKWCFFLALSHNASSYFYGFQNKSPGQTQSCKILCFTSASDGSIHPERHQQTLSKRHILLMIERL